MKTVKLNNGVEIPILGFGTFQITDPSEAETAVKEAIKAGYRHIDTAQSYMNEEAVGRGIASSGVDRKELFITTKVWVENTSYQGVISSFERSLKRLGLDYVDLLLIHQPFNDVYGAWLAMEELQKEGKIRAIGVSNFAVDKVVDLAEFNEIVPQVNQIEINPFQQQTKNIEALKAEGIMPEAWAPFAEGKNNIFSNPILVNIGEKYNKSVAQVILRWLVEKDIITLAKSVKPERMKENLAIFDFELTEYDKVAIATLNEGESQFFSHADPDMIRWMASRKLNV
ncbi:aldo/keto reductase [Listeria ivanovii]|uniref:Putative oxidoreductase, aldo/keto reductase family n=1 Tax=Listeria ivanovii (strain ATCC BAA-678 / PAM 55) TaxID=881621 RepID=G2ZF08_LISIP|nr:aldo/keto reductase [Listeria ivanovii]AHI56821.1 2,5-diketo-D-gluconic acid reductase [Listeria ivanovii WSLC3009]AIS66238.1 2,5-diketo-D-gluconic acid reductase [Listeria ivanovii subsp. ivanovii]MBC1759967.1 aldo/keto reductase [Listeria ivanovii]MBK3915217.1 aldo/keto reductase [Listeria ivanovii subsp. ivanovii]MBK3922159.1 aldo/keto reductase [Listeria ivanovii subsp. ivanovii]